MSASSSFGPLVRRDRDRDRDARPPPLRTLDDIRNQVTHEVAMRAIAKGKLHDGVRTGVCLTFSKSDDELFLRSVAAVIEENLLLQDHLFIIGTTGIGSATAITPLGVDDSAAAAAAAAGMRTVNALIICGSSFAHIDRARLLTGSKFLGRITGATDAMQGKQWIANVLDLGAGPYDEVSLWDIVRKSVRAPCDPRRPPPLSKGIDELLEEARVKLIRLAPEEAYDELRGNVIDAPAFLVDIRPVAQREQEGGISGSLIVERNVLEWRFDPRCEARLAIADRYDLRVIVFCQEGYTSSLAAYALQQLGLYNATDIVGGFKAWKEAGLPVESVR